MSRDDLALIRHSSMPAVGESNGERPIANRLGSLVVTDLMTQLVLGGWAYAMQVGTEDAPVASTAAIDDQLVFAVADNNAGYAMIPLFLQIVTSSIGAATLIHEMLEWDKDKVRYSSGGTLFVPANLRGDDPRTFNGTAYVGTDVTVAAKSAVPNSVELARHNPLEDALADAIGYLAAQKTIIYSAREHPLAVGIDACSFLVHYGATTGDCSGYATFQFAQLDKAMVV